MNYFKATAIRRDKCKRKAVPPGIQ